MTSFVTLPLPFFVLSRASGRAGQRAYDLERELTLPQPVDRSLEALMRRSAHAVPRLSHSGGGSLLVVAKRKPSCLRSSLQPAHMTGRELEYVAQAIAGGHLSGDGPFTERCRALARGETGAHARLLTHSARRRSRWPRCSPRSGPGDEVIVPSFTFVSTANAFVLRGATPVFADIRPDTLNLDETLDRGRDHRPRRGRSCRVHYAGVGCEMDAILAIARATDCCVIEDNAQGVLATLQGPAARHARRAWRAELPRDQELHLRRGRRAADQRRRATSSAPRSSGRRAPTAASSSAARSTSTPGSTSGSSYLPEEIVAAFLCAQLEQRGAITRAPARSSGTATTTALAASRARAACGGRVVPADASTTPTCTTCCCRTCDGATRSSRASSSAGVQAVFHYVPLHSSPAGSRSGRAAGPLAVTDDVSDRLVRLPLWADMRDAEVERVVSVIGDQLCFDRDGQRPEPGLALAAVTAAAPCGAVAPSTRNRSLFRGDDSRPVALHGAQRELRREHTHWFGATYYARGCLSSSPASR